MSKLAMGSAIQKMFDGLAEYADAYRDEFDSEVGEDYVLGDDGWIPIAEGLLALLNGETGRVDPGKMDGYIRRLMKDAGAGEESGLGAEDEDDDDE